MTWWDDTQGGFLEWMNALFGKASESSLARGHAIEGSVQKTKAILNEHEKAAGVTPASTPAPKASPSPTPVPNLAQQSAQDTLNKVLATSAPEFAAMQRQTQGSIGTADPSLPVFEKREKKKGFAPSGLNSRDVSPTTVTNDVTRTLQEVASDPYGWDTQKLKSVYDLMVDAGRITPGTPIDRQQIAGIWANYASTSALMYQKGNRMSPFDLLKAQSYGQAGTSLAKTTTSTDTNYTVTNATTAKQLAQAALSARVGRMATDEEVNQFIAALRAEEKKNPTVQTTTTTTNAKGTSQSSTSTTKQGTNPNAFADSYAMNYNTEEAKAYQAAGYYGPIFFDALKAPV